jgi:hypothetical protein
MIFIAGFCCSAKLLPISMLFQVLFIAGVLHINIELTPKQSGAFLNFELIFDTCKN